MSLEQGRIRIRSKGSAGGHKGLADIIERIGTEEVGRLRIGIGQSAEEAGYDYVLAEPAEQEKKLLDEASDRARAAIACWIEYGIDEAMNEFNCS